MHCLNYKSAFESKSDKFILDPLSTYSIPRFIIADHL